MDLEVVTHELERAARQVIDAALPSEAHDPVAVSAVDVGHLELASWLSGVSLACAADRSDLISQAQAIHEALLRNAADFSRTDEAQAEGFRIDLERLGP